MNYSAASRRSIKLENISLFAASCGVLNPQCGIESDSLDNGVSDGVNDGQIDGVRSKISLYNINSGCQ